MGIPVRELPEGVMAVRYDDTVHAVREELGVRGTPLCDTGMMPACAQEYTGDDVDCMWCVSILA